MLRIFPGTAAGNAVVLRLEGQVRGLWVEELRRSCAEILSHNGNHLVLDLAEVSFIDANGIGLFRELSARHVALSNCSLFAAEQLKEMGLGL